MTRNLAVGIVTILMAVAGLMQPAAIAAGEAERWVGTWSTALHAPAAGPPGLTNQGFDNQTLRQIVRTTVGGDRVRVRVSTFGAGALAIGAAHVALRAAGAAIVAASDRTLTFGGHPSVIVPAGASSCPTRLTSTCRP